MTAVVSTIVLAAGTGARFQGLKQFADLHGRPLVEHAVSTAADVSDVVVVVVPEGYRWQCQEVVTVCGGPTRAASVRRGLAAVPSGATVVAVHDAAHPLASARLFEAAIERVRGGAAAAVPVVPVTETLAHLVDGELVDTVPRATPIVAVQSPQVFRAELLRSLVSEPVEARDEVSLFLSRGHRVAVVAGDPRNVHVTTAEELAVAARLAVMT